MAKIMQTSLSRSHNDSEMHVLMNLCYMHTHTKAKMKPSAAIYMVALPAEVLGRLCTTYALGICVGKPSWDKIKPTGGCPCRRCRHLKSQLVLYTPCIHTSHTHAGHIQGLMQNIKLK